MRAPVVVELDTVADLWGRVLLTFEPVAMDTLFLQRADDAFHHAILLWAARRDELLLQV